MPQPVSSAATVACELTGVGRGGVATVGLWTPAGDAPSLYQDHVRPFFRPANPAAHPEPGRIVYGTWYGDGVPSETPAATGDAATGDATAASAGESVVVTAVDRRTVHVHCHGGRAAVEAILQAVESTGAVRCPWPEWLTASGMPLLEVEAREVLAATNTRATAAIAYDQVRGALQVAVGRWLKQLTEDAEPRDAEPRDAVRQAVRSVLDWKYVGQHLQRPWQVVLAGEPNVGKSSLMNALVGYDRAITFDSPGTTRDILAADTVLDGWPVQLSDTAGLRQAADSIEDEGVRRARQRIEEADLTLWIQDARQPEAVDAEPTHLVVRNKVDLLPADHDERRRACEPERSGDGEAIVCISATAGWNLDGLIETIVRRLVPQSPSAGQPMPINARQEACLEAAAVAETAEAMTAALEQLMDGANKHSRSGDSSLPEGASHRFCTKESG